MRQIPPPARRRVANAKSTRMFAIRFTDAEWAAVVARAAAAGVTVTELVRRAALGAS